MKVAATPVVEPNADLKNPVIEISHRRARVAPQKLERFMLLEELARVELRDAANELIRWRIGTARAGRLVGCARRLPFWRARGLA